MEGLLMSIKNWFGIGDAIAKPIQAIGDLYTTDRTRITAETEYQKVTQQTQLAQIQNNQIDAISESRFNSGWRPLCGYICALSLAWTYLLQPVFIFIITAAHGYIPALQNDSSDILPIITGMLGLGILRSVEKINKSHLQ